MINNFDIIKPLLKFESDDEFYFLQILGRKKDSGVGCSSNSRVVKNYFIHSLEYLENKMDEIIGLCDYFNARAYLRLNRRSYEQVGFKCLEKIVGQIYSKDFQSIPKFYQRACGQYNVEKEKKWIIDLDKDEVNLKEFIYNKLEGIEPFDIKNKVFAEIPSKNGLHLITTPFNVHRFGLSYSGIDIHKDNPTNLYIPD
jgi:hypothetical protein